MSHYDVLGIPPDADEAAIRRAFRRLARRYHPDAGGGSSAERFRQAVIAYRVLSDRSERESYDRTLRTERHGVPIPVEPMVGPRVPPRFHFNRTRGSEFDHLFEELLRLMRRHFW